MQGHKKADAELEAIMAAEIRPMDSDIKIVARAPTRTRTPGKRARPVCIPGRSDLLPQSPWHGPEVRAAAPGSERWAPVEPHVR